MKATHPVFQFLVGLALALMLGAGTAAYAADNPALWKYQVKGDFNTVLASLKTGLEARQFQITGEENMSKGLENNKKVLGEDKWNTIGFQNVTVVHFCSIVFNQEVYNLNMDLAILCPFKVVVYNMKAKPDQITILTTRPTYLVARDRNKKVREAGKKIEERIVTAIKESVH
ncbi:hypothetical protein ACFDAU_12605 [Sulfuriferula sp. GW1]|uniref:hypothetical protein n=1 Tax=Sulfuriferula sp. GW1 TaxID=3345111 RepID=UPI0039AEE838